MKFTPYKEDELTSINLLPKGIYDFTVLHAEEKVSRAGNNYLALRLSVYDDSGKEHVLFTNLALPYLLKHFCDVGGLKDKYELGEINPEDCIGKCGLCDVGIEDKKPRDTGGYYPAKNIVLDYVCKTSIAHLEKPAAKEFHDDDLPF